MNAAPNAMSRRSLLGLLGVGIASALNVSCGPAVSPAAATSAPAPLPTTTPGPAPVPSSTTGPQPTLGPTAVAQVSPTRAPEPRNVRLATWVIGSSEGLSPPSPVLRLRAISQKLPDERSMAIDLVKVDTSASNAPLTASQIGLKYAEKLASGAIDADLIFADHTTLRALVRAKLLRDLGPVLDKESWFKKDDFWSNILQAGQIRGVQVSLPMDASVEILAYNRTVLKGRGIDVPPSWTWEQFIAIARKATSDGKWGFATSPWSPNVFSLAWQEGAKVVGSESQIQVTEPGTLKALDFLDRLLRSEHISAQLDPDNPLSPLNDPFREQIDWPPEVNALNQGKIAMLARQSNIPGRDVWWREAGFSGYDESIATLPSGNRAATFGTVFSLLAIPTRAPNPDFSLAALHDLLDATDLAGVMPPRKTIKNLHQVSTLITEEDSKVLLASLATARYLPGDATGDVLDHVAKELVLPVLTGKKKPQDAANDTQKLINADLA